MGYTAATAAVLYGGVKAVEVIKDVTLRDAAFRRRNVDVYSPDRPIPHDKGIPIPDTDAPHTQLGQGGKSGKYPKARELDKDGEVVRDIDFTDHGYPHNHPLPHEHRWKDNPTGGTKIRDDPKPIEGWKY